MWRGPGYGRQIMADKPICQTAALQDNPFTSTLMTIELQERGKWNFGAVEWRNILVEANTTESKWCEE